MPTNDFIGGLILGTIIALVASGTTFIWMLYREGKPPPPPPADDPYPWLAPDDASELFEEAK